MLGLVDYGGFNSAQIAAAGNFNGFVGSMAGAAATYGLTGNVTLNVASIKGHGFLEMSLGNDGFGMRLGSGGGRIETRGEEPANRGGGAG
jgi:hypothetical protein